VKQHRLVVDPADPGPVGVGRDADVALGATAVVDRAAALEAHRKSLKG